MKKSSMAVRLSALLTLAGGVLSNGSAKAEVVASPPNPQSVENRIQRITDQANSGFASNPNANQDDSGLQTRWWGPVVWGNGWHNGWPNWGNGWQRRHYWHNWGKYWR